MMARLPVATGSIQVHGLKPVRKCNAAAPTIHPASAFILTGPGHGRPIANPLHPNQSNNPVAKKFKSDMDKLGTPAEGFNVVCTTYRLTEHYHYWTKNNPMNVQLVPEPFVEVPAQLADEMGIRGGEKVKVTSARGAYIAKAMVTKRIKPMTIDGKKTYQIGVPIHWGYRGISEDAGRTSLTSVNLLSPAAIDPNAYTPEFKGFLVKIEKA